MVQMVINVLFFISSPQLHVIKASQLVRKTYYYLCEAKDIYDMSQKNRPHFQGSVFMQYFNTYLFFFRGLIR